MRRESPETTLGRALRGRTLMTLAVVDLALFLIANVAYGSWNQHGLRNEVSNVTWAVFLIGFILLLAAVLVRLGQIGLQQHARAKA